MKGTSMFSNINCIYQNVHSLLTNFMIQSNLCKVFKMNFYLRIVKKKKKRNKKKTGILTI